jgi:uracil-DNA glycosylase family 4
MVPTRFASTPQSRLVFIGEAPGNVEIARGEPFLGPSGQLLNNVLGHYGVVRDQVTLTNATLCHYPKSMKKIPKEAIEACRPRLLHEIETANTTTVIPMGNSAIQGYLPKDMAKPGITQLRTGRPKVHPTTNHTVVPTFHPAACLRSQEKFPLMLGDIGKAISSEYLPDLWYEPNIVVVEPGYTINGDTPTDLVRKIMETNKGEIVFYDVETSKEKDVSYGNVHMNKLLCCGVGPTDPQFEDTVFVFTADCFEKSVFRTIWRALIAKTRIGAQNRKYDVNVMRQLLGYSTHEWPHLPGEDTMLQSYVNFEYAGVHGLEYMGMELLGTPDWKHAITPFVRGPDGKGDVDYANVPSDILYKYNAFDVHATRLLHRYFSRIIEEEGLEDAYRFTLRVSDMLTLVEPRGLGFDVPYSEELAADYHSERDALELSLPILPANPEAKSKHLKVPHRLNVDSPQQVLRYFHLNNVKVEDTEADTLAALLPKFEVPDDVKQTIKLILDIRKITKMDGTFVSGLAKKVTPEGTVHPSFLVHGTTSGRLSARNPNSQNIPRADQIKRQFIARSQERTLVGVDMSQAELRVLTWLAKEELTRDIFNDPSRDIFVELCRSMFPERYTASMSDKEVKSLSSMESPGEPSIRTLVKTFAYGIAYGRTASGIAADPQFNMDVSVAQKHLDTFSKTVPNIIAFLEDCADRACNYEPLVSPFGRKRRFHLVTPLNRHAIRNEAKSFPAQTTASDIVLEAACRLTFDHEVFIVNLVHDAIYADVPISAAPLYRDLISRVMIETAEEITQGYVKFATEGKIGRSWADV